MFFANKILSLTWFTNPNFIKIHNLIKFTSMYGDKLQNELFELSILDNSMPDKLKS